MFVSDDRSFKMQIDEDYQKLKKRQGLLRSKIKDNDYIKIDYIIVFIIQFIVCINLMKRLRSKKSKVIDRQRQCYLILINTDYKVVEYFCGSFPMSKYWKRNILKLRNYI